MTTNKQREANKRNAQRSTGPKTAEGKRKSRLNAVKHGLTGNTVVISDEDPAAFDALCQQLMEEYHPGTTGPYHGPSAAQPARRQRQLLYRPKRQCLG